MISTSKRSRAAPTASGTSNNNQSQEREYFMAWFTLVFWRLGIEERLTSPCHAREWPAQKCSYRRNLREPQNPPWQKRQTPDPRLQRSFRVLDRKSTRLNSSHLVISYAVFCLKKKNKPSTYSYHTIR